MDSSTYVRSTKDIFQILGLMPGHARKHHNVPGVKFFRERGLVISADEHSMFTQTVRSWGRMSGCVEIGLHSSQLSVISQQVQ